MRAIVKSVIRSVENKCIGNQLEAHRHDVLARLSHPGQNNYF